MSNPFAGIRWIWMNGQLIEFEKATVHVLSHALHYGSGVFEGIRCYNTRQGPAVFRLAEHLRRLENSAKIYRMPHARSPRRSWPRRCSRPSAPTSSTPATSGRSSSAASARWASTPCARRSRWSIAVWPGASTWARSRSRGSTSASPRGAGSRRTLPAVAKATGNYLNSPAHQDGGDRQRLRRGHRARRPRLRQRGLGREHLPGAGRRADHAARGRVDPARASPATP